MTRTVLMMFASAALLAAPSFAAAPGKGHGAKTKSGAIHAKQRVNGKGPAHASATGTAHASRNSVLHGSTVASGPLSGLGIGSTVTDSKGNVIGSVRKILVSSSGTVRKVLVRSANGSRTIPLSASALSLAGGTVVAASWPGRR